MSSICGLSMSSASSRLALAVFYRAYIDSMYTGNSPAMRALRDDAIGWLREFGFDFLVMSGVGECDAGRMIGVVLAGVPPFSNTGAQNEDGRRVN